MKSTSRSHSSAHVSSAYAAAVVLWGISFLLPAVEINGSMQLAGYRVFTIGIEALRAGMPGWLANPALLLAVYAGLRRALRAAAGLSVAAVLLSLSSFYAPALARSQGLPIEQVEFKVGFFLWLAACSVILAANLYALATASQPATAASGSGEPPDRH